MKRILIAAFLVIIIGVSSVVYFAAASKTSNSIEMNFIVSKDMPLKEAAVKLQGKAIIRQEKFFLFFAKLAKKEGNVKAGNYIISPSISYNQLLDKLQRGKSDFSIITIPEGYSLYQVASRLEKNHIANKDNFLKQRVSDIDKEKIIGLKEGTIYELEGYLFPDTYYIRTGASQQEVAQMMFDRFRNVLNDEALAKAKALGFTPNEIMTVASLVEKEAANDSEKKKIAGVIYNRIKRGMPLQIDASVIYAVTKGEKSLDKVYYSTLKTPSKYNTYLNKGLPPGPIASPGSVSIEAALNPETHNYLYYVLGDNGHVFSNTYEEHMKNVKKYMKP